MNKKRGRFVQIVRELDGKTVEVAYAGDGFWAYSPETDDFRLNESIYRDFVATETRNDYLDITPDQARALIAAGVGASDPRMLDEVRARRALTVADVFERVG
jgi:hypothetical protein